MRPEPNSMKKERNGVKQTFVIVPKIYGLQNSYSRFN